MSGEEFSAATEERSNYGTCANPLCANPLQVADRKGNFIIDSAQKKVYLAVEGPQYCTTECATAATAFAHRLGSATQAVHRFERLLDHMRAKKKETMKEVVESEQKEEAEEVHGSSTLKTSDGEQPKVKSVLKKKLAAGTSKVPIMTAEVQEREQPATVEPPRAPSSARKSHAVEGYVPRSAPKIQQVEKKEQKRRVRFSDVAEADDDDEKEEKEKESAAAMKISTMVDEPMISVDDDDDGSGRTVQEAVPAAAVVAVNVEDSSNIEESGGKPAVFVLDVDEQLGHEENNNSGNNNSRAAEKTLASQFGRLRVATLEELLQAGLPAPSDAQLEILRQQNISQKTPPLPPLNDEEEQEGGAPPPPPGKEEEEATTTKASKEENASIEALLMERLRQGAVKYFPQLVATPPPDLAKTLEESLSDTDDVPEGDDDGSENWSTFNSDEEESDAEYEMSSTGGGSGGGGRIRLSFFGEFVNSLDQWVTDATICYLRSSPEVPPPGSTPDTVPEIQSALSRFLHMALPAVLEHLAVQVSRTEVERGLMDLLRTFYLVRALPAFKSSQWQLVVMVLLKALSIDRMPSLRPYFEGREAVHRGNAFLTANLFTVEEFVAVLEVLLEEGL